MSRRKKVYKRLSPYLIRFGERGLSIDAFIFPLVEAVSYFGPTVFLNTDSVIIRMVYSTYIEKLSRFYTDHNLVILIFTVWVFILCSCSGYLSSNWN